MYTVKILRERTVIVIKELHRHHHIVCLPRKKNARHEISVGKFLGGSPFYTLGSAQAARKSTVISGFTYQEVT